MFDAPNTPSSRPSGVTLMAVAVGVELVSVSVVDADLLLLLCDLSTTGVKYELELVFNKYEDDDAVYEAPGELSKYFRLTPDISGKRCCCRLLLPLTRWSA